MALFLLWLLPKGRRFVNRNYTLASTLISSMVPFPNLMISSVLLVFNLILSLEISHCIVTAVHTHDRCVKVASNTTEAIFLAYLLKTYTTTCSTTIPMFCLAALRLCTCTTVMLYQTNIFVELYYFRLHASLNKKASSDAGTIANRRVKGRQMPWNEPRRIYSYSG